MIPLVDVGVLFGFAFKLNYQNAKCTTNLLNIVLAQFQCAFFPPLAYLKLQSILEIYFYPINI